jgi:tRNA dimethylallyltransferase
MKKLKPKLIVILGPTSSGKSDLAVKLALRLCSGQAKKEFGTNGAEIVSADSRQVYKGMDIGTGKITKKEMKGIPHHLLDVVLPKRRFTVVQYQKLAQRAINKILKRGKIPILCGGTGFYIQAVVNGIVIPRVKPDWQLRKKLERKKTEELFKLLKKLDSKRAKNIDRNNRRRLIRALEILIKTKKPIPKLVKKPSQFDILMIGVKKSSQKLKKLIKKRLLKRLREGMIAEVKRLKKSGLSWKRLAEFGLEYKYLALFLQKKLNYQEMLEKLQKEIEHFAKRQMTWFKRDQRIHWIKNQKEAERLTRNFLIKQKGL